MKFCYDLSRAPASWDFCTWLAGSEMLRQNRGAPTLEVAFRAGPAGGFRADNLPMDVRQRQAMLDNVMRPLLDLLGGRETSDAGGMRHEYLARFNVRLHRYGAAPCDYLKGLYRDGGYATITLREADYWPQRNSNWHAWNFFAMRLEKAGERVIFVRDTAKAHIASPPNIEADADAATDLLARARLYAGARMNLFVSNGPAALVVHSRAPYLIFKPLADAPACTPEWWAKSIGVSPGGQYPWATETQRIVWAPDDLETLISAWDEMRPLLDERKRAA